MSDRKSIVVIPNWNGRDSLQACLESLENQTTPGLDILVVDNGSIDNSVGFVKSKFPNVKLILQKKNRGFAGGVNPGIKYAMEAKYDYVLLLNNDAKADKDWSKNLIQCLNLNRGVGIATGKIMNASGKTLDSTGDIYTSWGLSYPRGRGEPVADKYDRITDIFAASGGASIYRVKMLKEIGIFDEDYFAYYEDVDISFRAQLFGWKIRFVPAAKVLHEIGVTSGKIKGFTTYQTMKNYPMLLVKNVPSSMLAEVVPRFGLAYFSFYFSAISRRQIYPATKGLVMAILLGPKKLYQRHAIQKHKKVSSDYIRSIIVHDLPPNAYKLRKLREGWHKGKRVLRI